MDQHVEPVNWGVLGVANIATKKVIPAMQGSAFSPVRAIASRTLGRAEQAADELGIDRAHGSYEALLADSGIEAVYIPLPNHLHLEWAKAAAAAGKHVLCEKPLTLTSAEASEMIAAAEAAGVLIMEAFMYRLHPLWKEVKTLVDDGAIGDLRSVQVAFSYFNDDPDNIRNIPEAGGGALYDIGCYAVNAARFLFGSEPVGVKGLVKRDAELGTDVVTSAILDFDGGQANFVCSTQMESAQRVDIGGTTGRIVVEIPFNIPPDRPSRFLLIAGGDPPVSPGVEVHEVASENPYSVQADAFSIAVRTDSPAPIPPSDAVANIEVMERIFADAG